MKPLSETMLAALRTARAADGLWCWLGGYWLPQRGNRDSRATSEQLEGGWFVDSQIHTLVGMGLLTYDVDGESFTARLTPAGEALILSST
jgi:hypothetical protein